ncbi:ICE2-domain-containing protein [Lipomyces kononenkoae]|uniref:ICE2-domain-containing protein n=1 Tax=Lipomyces kononenkoae TaxID=34357 RepID=A0ACC3T649_LIPKO
MYSVWTGFNIFTNAIYLSLIILTIPLAFDVGGEECGLAFTLTLAVFYFSMATIRLIGRNTKFSIITHIVYYSQHVIIPSLFIMFLNIYSDPNHTFPVWNRVLVPWRIFLQNATAGFSILEGFCTLLVIQATGQISQWLIKKNSDLWTIVFLVASGSIISGAFYYLYRIYTFPITIGIGNATLIGVVLTCTTFLGGYGIVSKKGNLIESSLLFAYMVYCLYETFTDFQPTHTDIEAIAKPAFPPFPPIIVESYATIVSSLASTVPVSFSTTFDFILAAMSTITPSIVVSLAYRLLVLFATIQIIPALREPVVSKENSRQRPRRRVANHHVNHSSADHDNSAILDDDDDDADEFVDKGTGFTPFVTAYMPVVLIAVYSHLLMQHFGYLAKTTSLFGLEVETWQLWSWVNCAVTLSLYASETIYGKESRGDSLTRHWKIE